MATRKGWEQLTAAYRTRLERGGISRTDYEQGVSLQVARGHKTPAGVGEKAYSNLVKLAKQVHWKERGVGHTPKQIIDEAFASGQSKDWIRQNLKRRIEVTQAYKRGDKATGKTRWDRRKLYVTMSWYWYH